ncbi:MAG: hypothetical protein M0P76_04265 [Candidatus Pacebacteria bacterium]|jgi:hypothetical protein|nr:hypothetical protein [Candidatus Paceibacterota bacterium]
MLTLILWLLAVIATVIFAVYSGYCSAEWRRASATWFTSYPEAGSEECIEYNGCAWEGSFAAVKGKQTEEWVKDHNIAAVHEKFFDEYKGKWLTIRDRSTGKEMNVQVLDMCSDKDCNDCCTRNMKDTGFLIDLEKYTAQRFNGSLLNKGMIIVEWKIKE